MIEYKATVSNIEIPEIQGYKKQFSLNMPRGDDNKKEDTPVYDTEQVVEEPIVEEVITPTINEWSDIRAIIKKNEGFMDTAKTKFNEPSATVGYGFFDRLPDGTKITPGMRISRAQADRQLDIAIEKLSSRVRDSLTRYGIKTSPEQFNILLDLGYHAGAGTVDKLLRESNGDTTKIGSLLNRYATKAKYGDPTIARGLKNRALRRSEGWNKYILKGKNGLKVPKFQKGKKFLSNLGWILSSSGGSPTSVTGGDAYTYQNNELLKQGKVQEAIENQRELDKNGAIAAATSVAFPTLMVGSSGAFGPVVADAINTYFTGDSIYRLASNNGIRKTANLYKDHQIGKAIGNTALNILDLSAIGQTGKLLSRVGKTMSKTGRGLKNAYISDAVSRQLDYNVNNLSFIPGKVKYYGPTMGKTTAAKTNTNLVDFDDIVRQPSKDILDKYGFSSKYEMFESGNKDAIKEYQDMLVSEMKNFKADPKNSGKTLVVSPSPVVNPEKTGFKFDNTPSIPSKEEFVRRNVQRGGTKEASENWWSNLIKENPDLKIDDRYISKIEQAVPDNHQLFRTTVYKGGDIKDPQSAFFTTDPEYAKQYGVLNKYLLEQKGSSAIAKEPMIGSRDIVTQDMFIDRNANAGQNVILGHDAITSDIPRQSKGIEILSIGKPNVLEQLTNNSKNTIFISKNLEKESKNRYIVHRDKRGLSYYFNLYDRNNPNKKIGEMQMGLNPEGYYVSNEISSLDPNFSHISEPLYDAGIITAREHNRQFLSGDVLESPWATTKIWNTYKKEGKLIPLDNKGIWDGIENNTPRVILTNPIHNIELIDDFKIDNSLAKFTTDAEWDKAYNKAIEAGDLIEAKRLRDLHYTTKTPNNKVVDSNGNPLLNYHGTNESFNVFDINATGLHDYGDRGRGFYFSIDPEIAEGYGKNIIKAYLYGKIPFNGSKDFAKYKNWGKTKKDLIHQFQESTEREIDRTVTHMLEQQKDSSPGGHSILYEKLQITEDTSKEEIKRRVKKYYENWNKESSDKLLGNIDESDVYLSQYENVVYNPNQIKLADPITYDDTGKIIPLSKRDNFNSPDIRYGFSFNDDLPPAKWTYNPEVGNFEVNAPKKEWIEKGEELVGDYFWTPEEYDRLIKSGASPELANEIQGVRWINTLNRKPSVFRNFGKWKFGESENIDGQIRIKYNSRKGQKASLEDPNTTLQTVFHELGGHGSSLNIGAGSQTIPEGQAPILTKILKHNESLHPKLRPFYQAVKDGDFELAVQLSKDINTEDLPKAINGNLNWKEIQNFIKYMEDTQEYSARAIGSNMSDHYGLYRGWNENQLRQYFTDESVDNLKKNVWLLGLPILGGAVAIEQNKKPNSK